MGRREKTPAQPIEWAKDGVIRFRKNRIVDDCLTFATCQQPGGCPGYSTPFTTFSMNTVAIGVQEGRYTVEEYEQFCQLVGYSVSGYGDLGLVRKKSVREFDEIADALYKRSKRKKTA